jgi:hypothetical protein
VNSLGSWVKLLVSAGSSFGSDDLLEVSAHNRFISFRLWWIRSRTRFCSVRASAEYSPCFHRARRDRANLLWWVAYFG